jgi:hypothetical protein
VYNNFQRKVCIFVVAKNVWTVGSKNVRKVAKYGQQMATQQGTMGCSLCAEASQTSETSFEIVTLIG